MATQPTKADQDAAEQAPAAKAEAEATPKAPTGAKVLTPAPVRYTDRHGVRTAEID